MQILVVEDDRRMAELLRRGLVEEGHQAVVARDGLATMKDTGLIEAAVDKVIAASPAEVAKYKGGKTNLLGFFVGKVKAELKGKGDPKVIGEWVAKKLS